MLCDERTIYRVKPDVWTGVEGFDQPKSSKNILVI
jgi:hypothetical protein